MIHPDISTVFAIVLAIAALIYAIQHLKKLEEVAKWISTQPVGNFPANIDAIIKVISESKETIKIMADLVAYGHFSAPDKSREYLQILTNKKLEGKNITLIVYDGKTSMRARQGQWKEKDFTEFLKKNPRKFEVFFTQYHPKLGGIPKDYLSFVEALSKDEQDHRKDIIKHDIDLRLVKEIQDLPFFLWLRDNREAIFSFYNLDDTVREISFQTTDEALITALVDVFERIKKKSTPAEEQFMTADPSD